MNNRRISGNKIYLFSPPVELLTKRLTSSCFTYEVNFESESRVLKINAEWPGDAFPILPYEIDRYVKNNDILPYWYYLICDNYDNVVGGICIKSEPNYQNGIEIGYGINESSKNNGFATEAISLLTSYIFSTTNVKYIIGKCNRHNISSIKVLKKNGFVTFNSEYNSDDGKLIVLKLSKNDLFS
jgi:ribosomal-protein-alanine N-acetyltransferase